VDSNDNEVGEMPDKEFKRMIMRMFNKIKKDTNKCLNKFKENINKQLNNTKKTIQSTKKKFNKDIENLLKIKLKSLEMINLISQAKNLVESLSNRFRQVEYRISGLQDKVAELEYPHSNNVKSKKVQTECTKHHGHH
jgi:hypothetical protein